MLVRIVQYGWSFFCSFFSRKYLPRHRAKQLTQRDYNKWLRILTTTGFFGLCTYVIATYKPDYDKTRRLNLAHLCRPSNSSNVSLIVRPMLPCSLT